MTWQHGVSACLTTLVRASCTIRNAARSIPGGSSRRRPRTCRSTRTPARAIRATSRSRSARPGAGASGAASSVARGARACRLPRGRSAAGGCRGRRNPRPASRRRGRRPDPISGPNGSGPDWRSTPSMRLISASASRLVAWMAPSASRALARLFLDHVHARIRPARRSRSCCARPRHAVPWRSAAAPRSPRWSPPGRAVARRRSRRWPARVAEPPSDDHDEGRRNAPGSGSRPAGATNSSRGKTSGQHRAERGLRRYRGAGGARRRPPRKSTCARRHVRHREAVRRPEQHDVRARRPPRPGGEGGQRTAAAQRHRQGHGDGQHERHQHTVHTCWNTPLWTVPPHATRSGSACIAPRRQHVQRDPVAGAQPFGQRRPAAAAAVPATGCSRTLP